MAVSKTNKFNQGKLSAILKTENQFITNLFSILSLPQNTRKEEPDEEQPSNKVPLLVATTPRATSLVELQNRIEKLTNKTKTYKEKIQKRTLQNRLKKKKKQEKRNTVQKQGKIGNLNKKSEDMETQNTNNENKLVFNKDDKMVFSKIDFTGLGKETNKKRKKNPKIILEDMREVNDKIKKLNDSGEIHKAKQIKEKTTWRNALAKAQGIKVKDDPILLKKSIQKNEQKKRSSKKKWENRIEGVKNAKDERQKKRTENIEKRKKEKKLCKLKKAAKKGKIIPGF